MHQTIYNSRQYFTWNLIDPEIHESLRDHHQIIY